MGEGIFIRRVYAKEPPFAMFTYTGTHEVITSRHPANDHLRAYAILKTSGTATFDINTVIDLSMIGGGKGGGGATVVGSGTSAQYYYGGTGGDGGFGLNEYRISVAADQAISVAIGAGGTAGATATTQGTGPADNGGKGGATTFLGRIARGGGYTPAPYTNAKGGVGSGTQTTIQGGASPFYVFDRDHTIFNKTQFQLGGGGGGGQIRAYGATTYAGAGGQYGGGYGWYRPTQSSVSLPTVGSANTGGGGGGGGGASDYGSSNAGAAGGSGVVIIRWGDWSDKR